MDYKRILIWEQNWLGDVLFSTPFIKAVRKKFKDSYIACIVNQECKEILEDNPSIDELIIYNERDSHRSIFKKIKFIFELKQKRFDAVFLLHRSLTRALITYFAGIRRRIGYSYSKRNFMLTDRIEVPDEMPHRIEYFLDIAKYTGLDISDNTIGFFISDKDRMYINKTLEKNGIGNGRFIVINPGGNWSPKRWPEESFAELSNRIIDRYKVKVVISGAEKDIKSALKVQALAKNKLVILCGRTNLKQAGALFEKAKAVITGDTGPLHIAVAVKANIIALFGPTSSKITGPYGNGDYKIIQKDIGCDIPCYDVLCSDNRCMKAITVDDVMEAVKRFL